MYRFEKLRVFHSTLDLIREVYKVVQKLPKEERFALIDQLKRAVVSIALNIVEGTGSLGDIEFKSFLRNALKSLYETVAGLKIAEKMFKVNVNEAIQKSEIVGRELNVLIKSLTNDKKPSIFRNKDQRQKTRD